MTKNTLDSNVFSENNDFKTFENLLEPISKIKAKNLSRKEFDDLKWNFLQETWEDKFGKKYDLFLPDDLSYWESLHFIDFLSNKFNLTNYTPYEKIISQIKVSIWTILREKWNEEWEKYLLDLSKKYNISDDFIEKIKDSKMNFSDSRFMIRKIKENRKNNDNSKLWENKDDVSLSFDELKNLFWEEFDLTFFRNWINILRYKMMNFTKDDYKKVKKRWVSEWEEINFRKIIPIYDIKEKLLRELIWIEKFKKELEELRKAWNKRKIEKLEIKASNSIIKILRNFPYQDTKEDYWYKPKKILETKEIYCVWFSILWHTFLSELWIKHEWINILWHSALSVIIWWQNYFFDVTRASKIYKFEYLKKKWEYFIILIETWKKVQIQKWNPEKVLLTQILTNKWNYLSEIWKYDETIKIYDRAIELNSNYSFLYNNKWISLKNIWKYDEAIKMYNIAIKLDSNIPLYYENKGEILYELWKYYESIEMYNKSIELNPKNYYSYNNKGASLYELWFKELWELYIYASDILEWNKVWLKEKISNFSDFKKFYISLLILTKRYNKLRLYLLSLEKN